MDCSLPGSSVRGILQARILEWVAIPFSRGSTLPWDWTQVSCIAGRFFTIWAIREDIKEVTHPYFENMKAKEENDMHNHSEKVANKAHIFQFSMRIFF